VSIHTLYRPSYRETNYPLSCPTPAPILTVLLHSRTHTHVPLQVKVLNPGYDYVPPELVDLFVTDRESHNPTYLYRLLAEYYNPDDTELK
jgi:translation initiation factor 2B subunit (eIF-2B alpha/beta/delta family)